MSNLITGLHDEICRNKEVLKEYEDVGRPGQFGAVMIRQSIKDAEDALASGDITEMIRTLKNLQETK